jgi:predicted XRE-type DNA-binding protein
MTEITRSSGNVFADLGFKDPETHLLKAELVRRIGLLIKASKLSTGEASKTMNMPEPDVADMLRGQFGHMTLDALMGCLVTLGQSVTIEISPTAGKAAIRVADDARQPA